MTFADSDSITIGDLTLRPLSLGTFRLLIKTKSELITPRNADGTPQDYVQAVAEYVLIHSANPAAAQAIATAPDFAAQAEQLAHTIPARCIAPINRWISEQLKAFTDAQFEIAEKPSHGRQDDPPPN